MNHRLVITEKTCWRHFRKLRAHGCLHSAKLEAWSTLIHNTATYGSGWWRLDLETLREAHRWELQHLRKAFPCTHEDTKHKYNIKTARFQAQLHKQHKQPFLIHKHLDNCNRNAHRRLHHKYNEHRNVTQELRDSTKQTMVGSNVIMDTLQTRRGGSHPTQTSNLPGT